MFDTVSSNGAEVATVTSAGGLVEVKPLDVRTMAAAAELQRIIDRHLLHSGYRRLLIDARGMAIAPKGVNDYMWQWARSNARIDKIAVVNQSIVMSIAVQMRAVASGQRLCPFADRAAAMKWLRMVEPALVPTGIKCAVEPEVGVAPERVVR